MADKLNDLAGRLGKGPRGLGTGLKVLAAAGAAAYGLGQSMYTGKVLRESCLLPATLRTLGFGILRQE